MSSSAGARAGAGKFLGLPAKGSAYKAAAGACKGFAVAVWGTPVKVISFTGWTFATMQWVSEDVLYIRCFAMSATACSMVFYAFGVDRVLWVPLGFCGLFLGINGIQILRLLDERRDIDLCEKTHNMFWNALFRGHLTKVQMVEILKLGRRRTLEPGEVYENEGDRAKKTVMLVSKGRMLVRTRASGNIATCGPGEFVNECRFLDVLEGAPHEKIYGRANSVTSLAVPASFPEGSGVEKYKGVEFVEWDVDDLFAFLDEHKSWRSGFIEVISQEIVHKMYKGNEKAGSLAQGVHASVDKLKRRESQDAEQHAAYKRYRLMLGAMLSNGVLTVSEAAFLKVVRKEQGISEEQHKMALAACGLDTVTFEAAVQSEEKA